VNQTKPYFAGPIATAPGRLIQGQRASQKQNFLNDTKNELSINGIKGAQLKTLNIVCTLAAQKPSFIISRGESFDHDKPSSLRKKNAPPSLSDLHLTSSERLAIG
jgi:hypothetical protein